MKLIFESGRPGRTGAVLPVLDVPQGCAVPPSLRRSETAALPEVSELETVRHFTNLSRMNMSVDTNFYPLGSCTMKYNPKSHEKIVRLPGFAELHPLLPQLRHGGVLTQGALTVIYETERMLSEILGFSQTTMQPMAGAHGELTGVMLIAAYHKSRKDFARKIMLIPDAAHGTNPASAAVCGLQVVEVKSTPQGTIDIESLRPLLDDTIAGIMMTNPNTLGLFETEIMEIARLVHECGGLLYYDGANFNPLLGKARPGDMGFDVLHLNLHKTFSTPHGGGGPGAGPVGVSARLIDCLPDPKVRRNDDGTFSVTRTAESAGRVSGFMGNFAVLARAYAYILTLGRTHIRMAGPLATLNANYVKESLKDCYKLPIDTVCKHEFVFDGLLDKSTGITTLDVAKRLLDYGFHAPTVYFPLLFHQSIMIEPTETESKDTLDAFIAVMRKIAQEAIDDPESLHTAPHTTPVRRLDETTAAKHPILTFKELQACTPDC